MKLSVIIPVYNVEKYLRKCVDSLLAQDYSNYEIILVDDGSSDNSPQICDEYVKSERMNELTNERVLVRAIHQENMGLSAARNAGLKVAKGEYVCFVDSDDYWEPNVLPGLMEQIERDKLDVLRFKYQNVRLQTENDGMSREQHSLNDSLTLNDVRYEVFNPNKGDPYRYDDYSEEPTDGVSFLNLRFGTACYAVMFIVRRELLKDCLFTEGIYFEDTDWTPRMLTRSKRVASTDTIVYNYLVRKGSITKTVERNKQQKVLDDKIRLIAALKQQAVDLKKSGRYNGWYKNMIAAVVVSVVAKISGDFYEERESYLKQLQELNILPIKAISIKARLVNLSPRFAVELLHIKAKRK